MRVLFVTWDGPQSNYLDGLFLPIFMGLREKGLHVDILQFLWGDKDGERRMAALCAEAGLGYRSAPVWRRPRPFGPFLSAVAGRARIRDALSVFGSDVIMPRSLMPALATLAAGSSRLRPIIFDADGLEADERVEFAGLSRASPAYRLLRKIEATMVRRSEAVLVRSEAAREVLIRRAGPEAGRDRFEVTPNGRDPAQFTPGTAKERQETRRELGIAADCPLVIYVGSVGGKYRVGEVARFMRHLAKLRPEARLLVLSGTPEEARSIIAKTDAAIAADALCRRVRAEEVPRYMAAADVGTVFIAPTFSMSAVAPIKLSEYLLCGLPIVGTAKVGDTGPAIEAGVFFAEEKGFDGAAEWVSAEVLDRREQVRADARKVGVEHFSLDRTVEAYAAALAKVRVRERMRI